MSEDEDEQSAHSDESFHFTSSAPAVATSISVASAARPADPEMEQIIPNAKPRVVEVIEEAPEPRMPIDFATDFPSAPRELAPQMEYVPSKPASLFPEPAGEDRDLDVPAFMRRAQF